MRKFDTSEGLDLFEQHRAYAKLVSSVIDEDDISNLLAAKSLLELERIYIEILDTVRNQVDEDTQLEYGCDLEGNIRSEGALWSFIRECKIELNGWGVSCDVNGMGDIALKVKAWCH